MLRRAIWLGVAIACMALGLFVAFRPFWASHFDLVLSDPVDGRFSIGILEHWTSVFHGQARPLSPNFFFPEKGVLGYSETFFLLSIPYMVARIVNLDRYLSFQLAMLFVTALGFASMLALLRRIVGLAPATALLGALLFVAFNMYYIHIVHPQLAAVAFVPLSLTLVARSWQRGTSGGILTRLYISSAALLLALILLTSFYIGWFTILFLATGAMLFAASKALVHPGMRRTTESLTSVWKQWGTLVWGVCVFMLALVPVVMVYLPVFRRTGTRDLAGTLYYMVSPLGALDVGKDNLVWGRLAGKIEEVISPDGIHEHPAGWPLLTISLFLATACYSAIRLYRSGSDHPHSEKRQLRLIVALSVTCVTLWSAGTKFGEGAPVWAILRTLAPGATAIRVPQRMNLVLNVGVVTVCMFGFERLITKALAVHRAGGHVVGWCLASALIIEQLNFMPTHLISRAGEARKFSKIAGPPKECAEFYLSTWSDRWWTTLEYQTDAILIAEQFNIPTLNGYSGWFPKDWDLLNGSRTLITERAREWAQEHNLSGGLCSLDLDSGAWSLVNLDAPLELGQLVEGAILNGGFEDSDLGPWVPFQRVRGTVSSVQAHSGIHSVAESAGVGSLYQDVTGLEGGGTYTVAAWVSGSPGATATAQISIFDPGSQTATSSPAPTPHADWQRLAQSITVSQAGTIRIHLFRSRGVGRIYWDDVQIYLEK